jgi:5-oxoprolinase (ATP-hydrolysing)
VGVDECSRGGSGAGPDWDGQNCVHVHMTNVSWQEHSLSRICADELQTAIGDVEVTERIYPVIINEFSRRHDSKSAHARL